MNSQDFQTTNQYAALGRSLFAQGPAPKTVDREVRAEAARLSGLSGLGAYAAVRHAATAVPADNA